MYDDPPPPAIFIRTPRLGFRKSPPPLIVTPSSFGRWEYGVSDTKNYDFGFAELNCSPSARYYGGNLKGRGQRRRKSETKT